MFSSFGVTICSLFLLPILLLELAVGATVLSDDLNDDNIDTHQVFVLSLVILVSTGLWSSRRSARKRTRHRDDLGPVQIIKRTRRAISSTMHELGGYSSRFYRMSDTSFWRLHSLLQQQIINEASKRRQRKKKKKKGAKRRGKGAPPNGTISTSIRLSVALRYFAGGDPLDIGLVHGVSHTEVFNSVWMVVDAIHNTDVLNIVFPTNHNEQRAIPREFAAKSDVGFDVCVGAIDRILIWTEKPTAADCKKADCGPKKFHCGRKHKFGLNMQGTVTCAGKFLDVSIGHPGSTSYFLSFVTSPLHHLVEQPGFLAPGLALFGDNAYVSNHYMVTPYRNVSSGPQFDFNYFQSQQRIRVECAFGMLVHRWGILRKAMPANIPLARKTQLVLALCKLHNYCIGHRTPKASAQDNLNISLDGGFAMASESERPTPVLDGGEHFEDVDRLFRREYSAAQSNVIPRQKLLQVVEEGGHKRQSPKGWSPWAN